MKVLVATGSSGGHIFPALSFLDTLKEKHKDIDTLLVLPARSKRLNIGLANYKVKYISTAPIALRFDLKNFSAIAKFLKGFLESLKIIIAFKPDAVIGFGSIDSVPLILLAWLLRIKTFIHEQNAIPGRANRLLAKFSDRVLVSFTETKIYLKINPQKIALTGNPIRQELKRIDRSKALGFFGFEEGKFTVLVMGGSLGSHRMNACFLEAVCVLPDDSQFQVIHIAGTQDFGLLHDSYKDTKLKVRLFSFLQEMQYAYSICDLVFVRAGATTIAELIKFSLPAVIVPYPFAYKHQSANAEVLEKIGAAIVIEDNKLDASGLRQLLVELMRNPERLRAMRLHYAGFLKTNANDLLINEVLSLN